jgi:hypothetical protein
VVPLQQPLGQLAASHDKHVPLVVSQASPVGHAAQLAPFVPQEPLLCEA